MLWSSVLLYPVWQKHQGTSKQSMGLERKILVMPTKRKCFLGNNVSVKKIRVIMLNCMICIDCVFYYNKRLIES